MRDGVQARGGGYRARFTHDGQAYAATRPTRAQARAWIAEQRARLDQGEQVVVPDPPRLAARQAQPRSRPYSVADASRSLCRAMRAGTARTRDGGEYKPSVIRKYEGVLRIHVIPRIGNSPIRSLERGDVQRLVDELAAAESVETARKALVALRVAYRLAERDGHTAGVDPCKGVRTPRGDKERPIRCLSPAESKRLIAAADDLDLRQERSLAGPLLRVALMTGLRLGEILALQWSAVDLDARSLHVLRSLDRAPGPSGEPVYVEPKSESSRRSVELSRATTDALRRHLLASGRPGPDALVFARPDGRPLDSAMMPRRLLRAACVAAKIADPQPRFHDCRHSYATALLAAGYRDGVVGRLLGHASARMVQERYGHVLPDELAGTAERLEALLGS